MTGAPASLLTLPPAASNTGTGRPLRLRKRDEFEVIKLIHGGLRYLQHGDIRLVYEALAERQRLLDNAPHSVLPLPFLIPRLARTASFQPILLSAGRCNVGI